jgi:glycine/D-amino acid oxidase-like deaminating enzyme
MVDYIIVGCGLAGIAFAEKALQNSKTIFIVNNNSQNSTKIAGGLYNPVILKRFSEVWHSTEQLELLDPFYKNLEEKLGVKLDYKLPLLRKFFSVEEQNNWFSASDKPNLSKFLSTSLVSSSYTALPAPFLLGEVLFSGFVDTALLQKTYIEFLKSMDWYYETTLEYSEIKINSDSIVYGNIQARHIVFAEGFGMIFNPFFSSLPLDGTKGELLLIKAPNLDLDVIVKSAVFVIPLGNDFYKVGATYDWEDKTNVPTDAGKTELVTNLKELIQCDFEIIEHYAGVRPTVKDRRPLIGTHPIYKNVHVLNGLGTRGVMLAPEMANELFAHIEHKKPLDKNIDIARIKNFVSSFCQNE